MPSAFIAFFLCTISLLKDVSVPQGNPVVVLRGDGSAQPITFLSWDTEGGDRAAMNLLYAPVSLSVQSDGEWIQIPADGARSHWSVSLDGATFTIRVHTDDPAVSRLRLVFPFNPRIAATTFFPTDWTGTNKMQLPGIISSPDFGQMRLSAHGHEGIRAALLGSRIGEHTIDLQLEWPAGGDDTSDMIFILDPVWLPTPSGFNDEELWRAIRRGWFNMLQPSSQWGKPGRTQSAPPGLLSNNVVSDPVSCVLHMAADHVLLQPELAPGISTAVPLRNTVDWWLDNGIAENGEMVSWRNVHGMLDANAGPLIGAWCYVEASGDIAWASDRIGTLEFLANYLAKRDLDGNGLVESVYSGNYGTQIGRLGASAYDTINSGHEDAYLNALTYRAWRCLADLERKLGREERMDHYTQLADRLKAAYKKRFYNPKTGWLAWWISKDGERHDLSAPMITSIAIMYGLVEPDNGRTMLEKLCVKIDAVGFERIDLGIPLTLEPVRKGDYSQPRPGRPAGTYGRPFREDGSDTFQQYLNGGCCVSDTYYFLTALYMLGLGDRADHILSAMLKRQVEGVFQNGGGFQNGVVDAFPHGAEFYDWSGNTTGYEGHLIYSFSFLQAILYRNKSLRHKVLRPLWER
jgi:hypothetical protein